VQWSRTTTPPRPENRKFSTCIGVLMKIPLSERWLSVDEIAEYLGIKRDTVYKWITVKGLPAHRVGRYWKFRKAEVDSWVVKGRGKSVDNSHDK